MVRVLPFLLLPACGATWEAEFSWLRAGLADGVESSLATGTGGGTEVEEEAVDAQEGVDDWIFTSDAVHTIAITLGAEAVNALYASPYDHVHGDVVFDGIGMTDIAVRLRGKYGAFRTLDGKPKLEVTFNEWHKDQRFFGLESMTLNNSVVDCSFMKESIAYEVFRRAGVPTERTSYAEVTINGNPYGLYTIIETPDDRFLKRAFAEPGGNLYDGKYILWDNGSYTLLDFNTGVDELFGLEEGTDIGHEDVRAVSAAIAAHAGTSGYVTALGAVMDWEEVHREWAAEQWVGHLDGYMMNTNNYRVYFDPGSGLGNIIPWDMDYTFLPDSAWGMSWGSPRGQLAAWCWADAECVAAQKQGVAEVLAAVDTTEMQAFFARIDAATWDASQRDPRQECGAGNVRPYRDALYSWTSAGNESLRAWWGL